MANQGDDLQFCEECGRELPRSCFTLEEDTCDECIEDIEEEMFDEDEGDIEFEDEEEPEDE